MRNENILTLYTKISSKWIKDLSVRQNAIKLLEENIGRTFFEINHSNVFFFFFNLSPRVVLLFNLEIKLVFIH